MSHKTDPDLMKRLKRAEGHLSSVVKMVAEGRDSLSIAQQMQAVIKALEKSKQMLIHDHIDHHLTDISGAPSQEMQRVLAEFREITNTVIMSTSTTTLIRIRRRDATNTMASARRWVQRLRPLTATTSSARTMPATSGAPGSSSA